MKLFTNKLRAVLAASILAITLATPAAAWVSWMGSAAAYDHGAAIAYLNTLPVQSDSNFAIVNGRWIYWWYVSGWWGTYSSSFEIPRETSANTCFRFLFHELTPTLNDRIRELSGERSVSEEYLRKGLVDECVEGDIPVDYTGDLPSRGQGIASISKYSHSKALDLAASILPEPIAAFSPKLRMVTQDGHFAFSMQRFGLTMEHKFIGDSGITSLQFNRKFGKKKQHLFQMSGELDRSHTDLNLNAYGLGTLYFDPRYSVNAHVQFRW